MNKALYFLFSLLIASCEVVDDASRHPCTGVQPPVHLEKIDNGTYSEIILIRAFAGAKKPEDILSLEIENSQLTLNSIGPNGEGVQKAYQYLGSYRGAIRH